MLWLREVFDADFWLRKKKDDLSHGGIQSVSDPGKTRPAYITAFDSVPTSSERFFGIGVCASLR